MRHEDVPPANEYERGLLIHRRKPHASPLAPKIGGTELVQPFVKRLLELNLPFTRLKIESLDKRVAFNLRRKPGVVNFCPVAPADEHKEKLENFCALKGLGFFAEYLDCPAWSQEPVVGCALKGEYAEVSGLIIELLTAVYDLKDEEKFRFALL